MRASAVTNQALEPGTIFLGRYEILRCIKAGGMGAVYEVLHLETRRRRALKLMLPSVVGDADLRSRFRLEATITADIETEHIVETFDAGVDPASGAPFLVMELLKGDDLDALLQARGRLSASQVIVLMSQVASALDKTHAAGIVHRDLKPENLFITWRDDGSPRLKILDFGIAKIVAESTQVKATRSMGSPLYMSPEQLQGDGRVGPRADIYSFAHVAYTALVGVPYWEDDFTDEGVWPLLVKMMNGANEAATARAARHAVTLPPELDAWFQRATARDASQRFASASETVTALGEALGVLAPRVTGGNTEAFWGANGGAVAAITGAASKETLASSPTDAKAERPSRPSALADDRPSRDGASDGRLDVEVSAPSSTLVANVGARVGEPGRRARSRIIAGGAGVAVLVAVGIAFAFALRPSSTAPAGASSSAPPTSEPVPGASATTLASPSLASGASTTSGTSGTSEPTVQPVATVTPSASSTPTVAPTAPVTAPPPTVKRPPPSTPKPPTTSPRHPGIY